MESFLSLFGLATRMALVEARQEADRLKETIVSLENELRMCDARLNALEGVAERMREQEAPT